MRKRNRKRGKKSNKGGFINPIIGYHTPKGRYSQP
jgi:hypothetical protein